MLYVVVAIILFALGFSVLLWLEVKRKHMLIWLPAYLKRRKPVVPAGVTQHVVFCFVDHYEPRWGGAAMDLQRKRVDDWMVRYPQMAGRHLDADGVHPQHSFFYPEEEYEQEHLDKLAKLCRQGFGEIEIHLHHDNDTSQGLSDKLTSFAQILHEKHGALSRHPVSGLLAYGFIHGNWSLDNSRGDGHWCGVNDEISILSRLGCYADFTLPSAPSDTQTSTINSIYYATDDPAHCKSHDTGTPLRVGRKASGDLCIIQGPLGLNWKWRRWGLIPRIENSDIRRTSPPLPARIDAWIDQHVHVEGRPEWRFVKIHTHGTQDGDSEVLLGEQADAMYSYLESRYNDGSQFALHYVTAREMYNIAKAAEEGHSGDPGAFRDFLIPRPVSSRGGARK